MYEKLDIGITTLILLVPSWGARKYKMRGVTVMGIPSPLPPLFIAKGVPLAVISINIDEPTSTIDQGEYISGTAIVFGAETNGLDDFTGPVRIRGRGNFT